VFQAHGRSLITPGLIAPTVLLCPCDRSINEANGSKRGQIDPEVRSNEQQQGQSMRAGALSFFLIAIGNSRARNLVQQWLRGVRAAELPQPPLRPSHR
jgi:hypothetical protein